MVAKTRFGSFLGRAISDLNVFCATQQHTTIPLFSNTHRYSATMAANVDPSAPEG